MKDKRIGVVMGGPSTEREVSLNTGRAVLEALVSLGYDVVGIDLEPLRFIDQLRETKVDIVFNAIHGKYGEDGILQGVLEMMGIPYTGSGVLASAIAMDKMVSKQIFIAEGIPTPRSIFFNAGEDYNKIETIIQSSFTVPLVVKSASQGSSIGVVIVNNENELGIAVKQAFAYSRSIIVEEFIKGKEMTVAILGNENPVALPIIEIVPHSGRYDYHSKYTKGATEYIVPALIDKEITGKIQEIALKAYKVVGCRGFARVDIMLDDKNCPYVLEINTIPGMTETSLVPKAAAAAGISFAELCERLLMMSLE